MATTVPESTPIRTPAQAAEDATHHHVQQLANEVEQLISRIIDPAAREELSRALSNIQNTMRNGARPDQLNGLLLQLEQVRNTAAQRAESETARAATAVVINNVMLSAAYAQEASRFQQMAMFRDMDAQTYGMVRELLPETPPVIAADITMIAQRDPQFAAQVGIAAVAGDRTREAYRGQRQEFRTNLRELREDPRVPEDERQRIEYMGQILRYYPPEKMDEANAAINRYQQDPTPENLSAVMDMLSSATEEGAGRIRTSLERTIASPTFATPETLPHIAGNIQAHYGIDIRNPSEGDIMMIVSDDTRDQAIRGLGDALASRNMSLEEFMIASRDDPAFLQSLTAEEQAHLQVLQLHYSVRGQMDIEHFSRAVVRSPELQQALREDIAEGRGLDAVISRLPNYMQNNDLLKMQLGTIFSDPSNSALRTEYLDAVVSGNIETASSILEREMASQIKTEQGIQNISRQFGEALQKANRAVNGAGVSGGEKPTSLTTPLPVATVQPTAPVTLPSPVPQSVGVEVLEAVTPITVLEPLQTAAPIIATPATPVPVTDARTLAAEGSMGMADNMWKGGLENAIDRAIAGLSTQVKYDALAPVLGAHNVGDQQNITYHEIENALVAAGFTKPEMIGNGDKVLTMDEIITALTPNAHGQGGPQNGRS